MTFTLTKHHGLGNDFLVFDVAQTNASLNWAERARRWCDRQFGIGADGLLLLDRRASPKLIMTLFNADGSRAEMSGNGIRCLAQAAYIAENRVGAISYEVMTDAGLRTVAVSDGADKRVIEASVEMGVIADVAVPADWHSLGVNPDRPVRHLSLGNPHSVVGVDDVKAVPLAELGSKVPNVNLEIVEAGPEENAVTMRVHERGAGITMACGTGACAVAESAILWGFVHPASSEVLVHMDGGDARVRIDAATRVATLIGPAEYIAAITVPA
jgi:diaminopimelate epimerase